MVHVTWGPTIAVAVVLTTLHKECCENCKLCVLKHVRHWEWLACHDSHSCQDHHHLCLCFSFPFEFTLVNYHFKWFFRLHLLLADYVVYHFSSFCFKLSFAMFHLASPQAAPSVLAPLSTYFLFEWMIYSVTETAPCFQMNKVVKPMFSLKKLCFFASDGLHSYLSWSFLFVAS